MLYFSSCWEYIILKIILRSVKYLKSMPIGKKRPRKIYMPGDLGDSKSRRLYRKPGPVITYKLREDYKIMSDILPLEEFLKLPVERAKEVMLDLSRNISDQKLAAEWSTQISYVRKLRCILGIHKDHSGRVTSVSEIKCEKWPPALRLRSRQTVKEAEKIVPIPLANYELQGDINAQKVKSFTFSLEGIFTAEELNKRIDAIKTLMINSSESKYALSISLEEIVTTASQNVESSEKTPYKLREMEEF